MTFADRQEAGLRLAERLEKYRGRTDTVVVALPRGGVVIGRAVADRLGLPLDVIVSRKIGSPVDQELAIGAITERGDVAWNEAARSQTDPDYLNQAVLREQAEARRRLALFRQGRPERDWRGQTVLLVDDGMATGLTLKAALKTARSFGPAKLVVAVPVAPAEADRQLSGLADQLVILVQPTFFGSVGSFYEDFRQVEDQECQRLLEP